MKKKTYQEKYHEAFNKWHRQMKKESKLSKEMMQLTDEMLDRWERDIELGEEQRLLDRKGMKFITYGKYGKMGRIIKLPPKVELAKLEAELEQLYVKYETLKAETDKLPHINPPSLREFRLEERRRRYREKKKSKIPSS